MFLLCALSLLAVKNVSVNSEANRNKARYFYLKGAVSDAKGNKDQAYEYYKKAIKADPDYSDASFAYAFTRLALSEDTFSSDFESREALRMMKEYIKEFPGDVEAAEKYAYVSAMIDSLPESIRIYNGLVKRNPGLSRLYGPLAYFHLQNGNADSAVYAIREFERLEGSTRETTLRKVTYWLSKQDTTAALMEADMYASENPGQPEPMVDKAMIYNLLGQPDSAIVFLEDALKQFPERSEMKFDIAMLYAEKGDTARFHSLVEEAFRGEDLEYEDRMGMLNAYTRNLPVGAESYTESDNLFEYAASLYPHDADFFDQYADYEVTKGDFKAALEKEQKALELNPVEPSFLGRLMSFSIAADQPEVGMKAFEKFNDKEKLRYPIILTYVGAAQVSEQYDKALEWLDTVLTVEMPGLKLADILTENVKDSLDQVYGPANIYRGSVVFEVAGDIYAKIGKRDDTERAYENSIILNPSNNALTLNNYAYFILETLNAEPGTEEFEKAKRMSRASLEQSGEYPDGNSLDTYAWILFKEQNYKDALEYIEIAVEADGEEVSSEILSHYGDILYMNERPDEALEQWEKALELDPTDIKLQKRVTQKSIPTE